MFGTKTPFSEPNWYHRFSSPYYKQTHIEFREKVRQFVETELIPFVDEWDETADYPIELHEKAYKAGIYGAVWPKEYGGTPPKDFDAFHDLILIDELSRCATGGVVISCFLIVGMALSPILRVGSQYLKDWILPEVVTGKKVIALCISEPYTGSDVANIQTSAVKDGDFYIINGEKKFITAGIKASYYTVAARTGNSGISGISLFLVPKDTSGVHARRMKTQGWWSSNTAFISFENVKIPKENLIGNLNEGFKAIVLNFNHERFVLAAMANRFARICLRDAIEFGRVRKTFGKRLVDHQVIRHKIADMVRHVESSHAWLEQLAYQLSNGIPDGAVAGQIALAKVQCTKTMEICAREASQIFGGNSYIRGGKGANVERLYREVRVNAISGGSEEILLDLSMKQAKL